MTLKHRFENSLNIEITLKQDAATAHLLRRIITTLGRMETNMAKTVQEAFDALTGRMEQSAVKASEERIEVQAALGGMQTTITALKEEVTALRDQLNNGTPVSDEQLGAVMEKADDLDTAIGDVLKPEDIPA